MSTLHTWQQPFLGLNDFPARLTDFEIRYFFHPSPEEHAAVMSRRGEHHRLGAMIHLGFIKMTGRHLDAVDRIPAAVLREVGAILALPSPDLATVRTLYRRRQTLFEHQRWAAQVLGFHPYTERRQRVLSKELRKAVDHALTPDELVSSAKGWLYRNRILIPGQRRLHELASRY